MFAPLSKNNISFQMFRNNFSQLFRETVEKKRKTKQKDKI
jgi:hypothetical protein